MAKRVGIYARVSTRNGQTTQYVDPPLIANSGLNGP